MKISGQPELIWFSALRKGECFKSENSLHIFMKTNTIDNMERIYNTVNLNTGEMTLFMNVQVERLPDATIAPYGEKR